MDMRSTCYCAFSVHIYNKIKIEIDTNNDELLKEGNGRGYY